MRPQLLPDSEAPCKPDAVPSGGRSFAGAPVLAASEMQVWRLPAQPAARRHAWVLRLGLPRESRLAPPVAGHSALEPLEPPVRLELPPAGEPARPEP
jgi:hypothetical protein